MAARAGAFRRPGWRARLCDRPRVATMGKRGTADAPGDMGTRAAERTIPDRRIQVSPPRRVATAAAPPACTPASACHGRPRFPESRRSGTRRPGDAPAANAARMTCIRDDRACVRASRARLSPASSQQDQRERREDREPDQQQPDARLVLVGGRVPIGAQPARFHTGAPSCRKPTIGTNTRIRCVPSPATVPSYTVRTCPFTSKRRTCRV